MADFPTELSNVKEGVTEIQAKFINNLEAKVGKNGSEVVTALDYLLKNPGSINPGHVHTLASLTDITALPAELNLLDLAGLTAGHVLRATGETSAAWGAIQAGDLPAGIDAAKIADASVSNTVFQYLAGVTSNIQTQLDVMLLADGSRSLTGDWDIGSGKKIQAEEIQARSSSGLKLYEDGGNGIFIEDGGKIGIGTTTPQGLLHLSSSLSNPLIVERKSADAYCQGFQFRKSRNGTGIQSGDQILRLMSLGELNTGVYPTVTSYHDVITSEATDTYTSSAQGRQISFWVIPTGSVASVLAFRLYSSTYAYLAGRLGIGTTSPSASLDINSDTLRLRTAKTPSSAGATGNAGDICWDGNYIYVCVATNTWKRAALSTW